MKLPLLAENIKAAAALCYPELLRLIFPPQAVIHIGAGTGNGDMYLWRQWQVPCALIVDADETRLDWAVKAAADNPAWQVYSAVLAESDDEIDYYSASNPGEDGLISSEKLTVLWPNLRISKHIRCRGRRLDNLLNEEGLTALRTSSSVWVLIDCLSSMSILQGAGNELDRWSVLWLRVLLKPLIEDPAVATLNDIEAFLHPHGYRCVHIIEGNHPAIGEVLFVRDWRAVLTPSIEQLNNENSSIASERSALMKQRDALTMEVATITPVCDKQTKLAAELQSKIDALIQEHNAHAKQSEVQIEALTQANIILDQEKSKLVKQRKALETEVAAASQAHDEQMRLSAELQSKIDALLQERDDFSKQMDERLVQIGTLIQDNAKLNQENSALVKRRKVLETEAATVTEALDEQTRLAAERQSRIEALVQEHDAHIKQTEEWQAQIQALTQTNATLDQEKSALAKRRKVLETEVAAVSQALDEQTRLAAERQSRIEALVQEHDAHIKQTEEWQAQIQALTQTNATLDQEKSALAKRRKVLETEVAAISQALDEQTRLAAERQSLIYVLTLERDGHSTQAGDRQGKIEMLTQANTKLNQEKSALMERRDVLEGEVATLNQAQNEMIKLGALHQAEIDQLQLQLQQKQAFIAKLQSEFAENDSRQRLLDEQMIKAEAQIDLIKDVLLRDPGL
ncbi:MAG: hypothetical protein NTY50_05475 [Methylobacter sp.]|nr:hypothetical protein [Methylobacter sp.]